MPAEYQFQSQVRWTGAHVPGERGVRSYTRDCLIEPEHKPKVPGSASAAYYGDDARYNPEDLMLASLAECHLLTYLALAARDKVRVVNLQVLASGTVAVVNGKMRFREAALRLQGSIEQAADLERARALNEPAHANCFMANSVNFPITLSVELAALNPSSP